MKANACNMPQLVPSEDKEALIKIRDIIVEGYCGQKQAQHYDGVESKTHKCLGKITFTHDAITMQCPLCGDEKRLL